MEDFFWDFKAWLNEKPIHKISFVLGVFAIILSLVGLFAAGFNKYSEISNRTELLQQDEQANNKYFEQLWVKEEPQANTKDIILTYDLYLKDPYISTYTLNTKLKNFVQSVKDKYNVNGNRVRAIGIRLYDRKIVWDKGLQPRAIAFYAIQQEIATKNMQSQEKKDKNNKDLQVKQMDGTTADVSAAQQDSPQEQSWEYTLDNKGKIDYNDYDLTVTGFQQYDKDAVNKPLTNQEFAFWLKLKLYQKILGTSNIDSAAILYLNYDLGGNVSYNDFVTISQDFEKFNNREKDLGDNTDYYPNDVLLRQKLAVYRPQLLYYALSGNMVKSRTEAQKKLIEMQPGTYNAVIREHNKQAAETTDKYGAENYYKGDPFVAVLGPYKKKYPDFSRPEFSPILSENSAFFNKSDAAGN